MSKFTKKGGENTEAKEASEYREEALTAVMEDVGDCYRVTIDLVVTPDVDICASAGAVAAPDGSLIALGGDDVPKDAGGVVGFTRAACENNLPEIVMEWLQNDPETQARFAEAKENRIEKASADVVDLTDWKATTQH